MTREVSSLTAIAFAVAVTAGLAFAVQLDTTPPWPVEKEYPDLGPIQNFVISDNFDDFPFDPRFHRSVTHPRFVHPKLTPR
jgi:hypothetical protein